MKTSEIDITPMLNAYPDSVGKNLEGMLNFLKKRNTKYYRQFLYFAQCV